MNTLNKRFFFYLPPLFVVVFGLVESGALSGLMGLNRPQAIAFGVLVLAAVLWVTEWIPLYLTSFVILSAQLAWLLPAIKPGAGAADQAKYLSPFFSEVILLFLGGFVLAEVLGKYSLDRKLAGELLKWTGTSPAKAMAGLMFGSAFLSTWMSNTATTAMMFAIVLPIVEKIPRENPFGKALLISIPFACNLGGIGSPIGTPPNAIAIGSLGQKGEVVSFGAWMLATIPLMLVLLAFTWFLLLKLFPPKDLVLELPKLDNKPLTKTQWGVFVLFGVTVVLWFLSDLMGLSIGLISLIPLVVAYGSGMLKLNDFNQLPWDVLFMVGGGMCLGVGLSQSGLTSYVVGLIPIDAPFLVILFAFGILAALMTTFMSNTATANLLIPLAVSLDTGVGVLVMVIALNCSTSMSLPISTPPNAIAFGSGRLEVKDMAKAGVAISVLALFLVILVGLFYWPLLNI